MFVFPTFGAGLYRVLVSCVGLAWSGLVFCVCAFHKELRVIMMKAIEESYGIYFHLLHVQGCVTLILWEPRKFSLIFLICMFGRLLFRDRLMG